MRATVVRSVRDSLHARGFTEVETPILQLVHGGANARPFETHINAYDIDLSLRIATELHLKRLVVGGMEQVFELGRQFRNEGADSTHNPEFTSLELTAPTATTTACALITQEIIQEAATAVFGPPVARRLQPTAPSRSSTCPGNGRQDRSARRSRTGSARRSPPHTPLAQLQRPRRGDRPRPRPGRAWAVVLEEIYGRAVREHTTTPVFYTDFPRETSPLTREHRDDPRLAEKWDLVIFASEQGTAYSELIDPSTSAAGSSSSRCSPRPATPRRWRSTRTSSPLSSTGCRRPEAWAWASTGWS